MIDSPTSEDNVPARLDSSDEPALTTQFMVRLGALLTAHHCEASPEGWRQLAVMLALSYEPTFKDVSLDNRQGPGEPPMSKPDTWANARLLKRQIESRATSQEEAAELLRDWAASREHRPHEAQLLDRLMVELRNAQRTFPSWIHRWLCDRAILKSAMVAAERLSGGCGRGNGRL